MRYCFLISDLSIIPIQQLHLYHHWTPAHPYIFCEASAVVSVIEFKKKTHFLLVGRTGVGKLQWREIFAVFLGKLLCLCFFPGRWTKVFCWETASQGSRLTEFWKWYIFGVKKKSLLVHLVRILYHDGSWCSYFCCIIGSLEKRRGSFL